MPARPAVRSCLLLSVLAAVCAGPVLAGTAAPAAAATPLRDARQRATALRLAVSDLEVRTDAAVEDYDAAEDRLGEVVRAREAADEQLDAARQQAADSEQTRRARVRGLYELGGPAVIYASLLSSRSPVEAMRGVTEAGRALSFDDRSVARDAASSARYAAAATAAAQAAADQVQQTQRVQGLVTAVQGLLDQQRELLGAADGTVRRLEEEQRAAAEQAAARAFAARVAAARAASGLLRTTSSSVPPSARVAAVLSAAQAQLGKPYLWGATGPAAYDCSGLTRWAYAAAGVALPRTSRQQWAAGPHPALSDLRPGDLLFWATDVGDPTTIHHVAVYLGGGRMVAAPHTGTVVQVQDVYADGFLGATRVL